MQHQIDRLDKRILKLISVDARIPFLEVARECNVSGAAIHQRIQKLRELGVIKGSEFVIDTYKIGYQTCAYVGIVLTNNQLFHDVVDALKKIPEIVECNYAIGKFSMIIKMHAKDNRHLLQLILEKVTPIPGVAHTETFQISLDEIFRRQLSVFDVKNENWSEEEYPENL
ncbi:MAG: AsnC family transcriptional regulator [Paludibacter sp.]|jgi:Lrp/AsnC family transcriptional regulator for asnA, asnC and gidA|nr:AsnC family transcriptional regulator [Paludibacter sp.]